MGEKLPETLDELIEAYEYISKQTGSLTAPMRHLVNKSLMFLRELREIRRAAEVDES